MKRLVLLVLLTALILVLPVSAQEDTGSFFFTEDGAFAVYLPEGWSAAGDSLDGLQIGNPDTPVDAMNDQDEGPQPGQAAMVVLPLPAAELGLEVDEHMSALELLVGFMEGEDMPTLGAVEEFEFWGRSAAMTTGSNDETDAMLVAYTLAPGIMGVAVVATAPGEVDFHSDQLLEVLDSVSFSLPLDETFEGDVSFSYPMGWVAEADESGLGYTVASAEGVADKDVMEAGEYAAIVLPDLTMVGVEAANVTEAADALSAVIAEEGSEASESFVLDVNGTEVALFSLYDEASMNEGGGFVVADDMGGYMGIIYATAEGELLLVDLTMLNILLSLQ